MRVTNALRQEQAADTKEKRAEARFPSLLE